MCRAEKDFVSERITFARRPSHSRVCPLLWNSLCLAMGPENQACTIFCRKVWAGELPSFKQTSPCCESWVQNGLDDTAYRRGLRGHDWHVVTRYWGKYWQELLVRMILLRYSRIIAGKYCHRSSFGKWFAAVAKTHQRPETIILSNARSSSSTSCHD